MRGILLILLITMFLPLQAQGQRRSPRMESYTAQGRGSSQFQNSGDGERDGSGAVLGAILGGVLGSGLGMALGSAACGGDSWDYDCLGPTVLGFLVGWTAGVGVGAHMGNNSRGNLGADVAASILSFFGGVALVSVMSQGANQDLLWMIVPVVQIGATVYTERGGDRRNQMRRPRGHFSKTLVEIRF